jgi:hypothetical protein
MRRAERAASGYLAVGVLIALVMWANVKMTLLTFIATVFVAPLMAIAVLIGWIGGYV